MIYHDFNAESINHVFFIYLILVKHNKITQGVVNCGDNAPDIDLFTLEGKPAKLFSQITEGQPLIILAGSGS